MYQAFYSARLDHLQLQSLERRCLIADLVLTYRIIFGLIDLNMSDHFMLQSSSGCSAATRGNPYKLLVNHRRINVRKHFFSERIIRVWNSLPPSIVSFKSLFSFKNSLGNVNLGLYTKYWSLFFYFVRCRKVSRATYQSEHFRIGLSHSDRLAVRSYTFCMMEISTLFRLTAIISAPKTSDPIHLKCSD